MKEHFNNLALVIAHPGHELRVFRFVELYKPRVYVLTDGAGAANSSRLHHTVAILEKAGASLSPVMGYFSDREIYRIILEKDYLSLRKLVGQIWLDFEQHKIQTVVGDAIEGYNPTHDLCRYLINLIVTAKEAKEGIRLSNFDFLLDGLMREEEGDVVIKLDELDFERKRNAAEGYTELSQELQSNLDKYGSAPFMTECLRKVKHPDIFTSWGEGAPFYEQYALEKVRNGVYDKAISFQEHLLPIIHHLQAGLV